MSRLQSEARRYRTLSRDDLDESHRSRSLRWWWEHNGSALNVHAKLRADQGVKLVKAIERIVKKQPYDPDDPMTLDARAADALVDLVSTRIAEDQQPDRAMVVLFVDEETVTGDDKSAETLEGIALHPEIARRLTCDCQLQAVARDAFGHITGVGRAERTPPVWLARQVYRRDHGECTFPGCGRRLFLHIHHIIHWARGGPTDLMNLTLLCTHHHHLVHEGGWDIRGNPVEGLVFLRPDGTPLERLRPRSEVPALV